jgi:hypothetical protein
MLLLPCASVARNHTTYIFWNDVDADDNRIVKVMKIMAFGQATEETLRVEGRMVPASDGPMVATVVDNGADGIRLYLIHRRSIVEYGCDSKDGEPDAWRKEAFADIKVDTDSILIVQGKSELKGLRTDDGSLPKLRLFFTKVGEPSCQDMVPSF